MVVIADRSKYVDRLGAFPLPVEIVPFGWQTTKALVEEMLSNVEVMGRSVDLRRWTGTNRSAATRATSSSICVSADLQPRAAEPHPQPDPGCRGERAVPRYLRRGDHRQPTARWSCGTSMTARSSMSASISDGDNLFVDVVD
jgi:hypothetical protein